jgi:hypothetical protein
MNINKLLGLKPVVLSFKSSKPIEIIHAKISDATDIQFNYSKRGKSKYFYGQIQGNQFDLKIYTDGIVSGKANTKIILKEEDHGTRIDIKIEFNNDLFYIFSIVIIFPGLLLLTLNITSMASSIDDVIIPCILFIGFCGFGWLILKFGYSLTVDLSKKALYKVFRSLDLR